MNKALRGKNEESHSYEAITHALPIEPSMMTIALKLVPIL